MIIPKLHYVSKANTAKEHLENIQKACSSGIELVQLVFNDNSEKKHLQLAKEIQEITSHFQTRLLITDSFKISKEIKADGIFLTDKKINPIQVRKHLYSWQMIGANAFNLADCEVLLDKQVDFITINSFKELGIKGFTEINNSLKTNTPLIGIGGITTNDVKAILKTGIQGIASTTAINANFNDIKKFNQLLKASVTDEQRYTFK